METAQATTYELSKSGHPTQPKIVAVIPCFNTEHWITDIVKRTRRYVDQVIVVNDGSHDGTAEVAKAAGAIVINHEARRGAGAATKTGFQAARRSQADVLVTLDGDGQHSPDELPQVLAPILNGEADLVIGSRFIQPRRSLANSPQSTVKTPDPQLSTNNSGLSTLAYQPSTNIPRYRKFGIDVITFLYNFGSKVKVSDSVSGFRTHSRRLVDAVNITEDGFGFSVQLLIQARKKGFAIKEVPISCLYHSRCHTLNPIVHGLSVAFDVVRLRLESHATRGY